MRIISGKFKGKPLKELKYDHIRPTGDKVKQALFTKFQFEIKDARVLDLFCGTGGLGIEAISRGAGEVVFVDKNPKSTALTKENLRSIKIDAKVFTAPYDKALSKLDGKFDMILVDPPYKCGFYQDVIKLIYEYDLLAEDGSIVVEHAKEDEFAFDNFEIYDQKRYGTVMLTFLKNKTK